MNSLKFPQTICKLSQNCHQCLCLPQTKQFRSHPFYHYHNQFKRFISIMCNKNFAKNHYNILGISPKATQSDIKAAYYRLSMIYHPDKNEGSQDAAQNFRDITAAYEVLGNFKLRRLYDKGIIHTADSRYQSSDTPEYHKPVEDDAQTKFYKQHMERTKAPHASGTQPIYNFDEWNEKHYGKSFQRNQIARKRYQNKDSNEKFEDNMAKTEYTMFGIAVILLITFVTLYNIDRSKQDDINRPTVTK